MPELTEHLRAPRLLVSARIHLSRALEQRRECIRPWNETRRDGPFSAWLEETSEDTAELWCAYRPSDELQGAVDDSAAELLAEAKNAMDAAVLGAAVANVGFGILAVDKHSMPLCLEAAEFDDLP